MNKGIVITEEKGLRIVKGTGYYKPDTVNDLKEIVRGSAERYKDRTGFKYKNSEGKIIGKTYTEFSRDIDFLGTELISMGLKDSRISIISENRYEWGVAYFSITNGTGIAVPLDKYLPENEVENLIKRGKVEAIFYSPSYNEMMKNIAKKNSGIKYFICFEKNENISGADNTFLNLPDLIQKGRERIESGDRSFTDAVIDRNVMSVLLFTSGTTSMSKGVMLSHANLAHNVSAITTAIKVYEDDVHLSLLPLHHTFENTVGLMFMVHKGVCIAYCEGIKHIADNIREYGVTLLVAVPAIFEAMYRKLRDGIKKSGKEGLIRILMTVSDILRTVGIDARRKLFKSVFDKFAPKLRLAVSGAAPIDPEVVVWFDHIGFSLLQGYGLTETSPVVAANNDFINMPGTIGYPLNGVEVAILNPDENGMGEIITRGGNVMLGYFEDPEGTKEAIDEDGWFRTGDLGLIDKEGFTKITGRAKSMIVFTNGKKAFPEEFEVFLNNIPGVSESFAWGHPAHDGGVQVCAKLVVNKEKYVDQFGSIPSDTELSEIFEAEIKKINQLLPQYKMIRYFLISYEDLIKTTTLKIKRVPEYDRIKEMLEKAGMDMRKASGRVMEKLV